MSDVISVGGSQTAQQAHSDVEYVGEGRVSYGGETMSVMEAVSMLFIERSEVFSDLAADKIQTSQAKLKQIKTAREWLQKMRTQKSNAGSDKSYISDEMGQWMKDNGIDRSGAGEVVTWASDGREHMKYDKDQWDVAIQNTTAHIETLTDSNQLEFLKLKSTVNKLDEAVSASNKMYDKNYDAIKAIFR